MPEARLFRRAGCGKSARPVRRGEGASGPLLLYRLGNSLFLRSRERKQVLVSGRGQGVMAGQLPFLGIQADHPICCRSTQRSIECGASASHAHKPAYACLTSKMAPQPAQTESERP
jgi:hypothetical protein